MSEIVKAILKPGIVPKFRKFFDIIQNNGGVIGSLYRIITVDDLKDGKLVGKDQFGNEYYENKRWYMGRSRWVVYSKRVFLDYDASQIPPDWHRWIHYTTDNTPVTKPQEHHRWMIPYEENKTGTDDCYVPYSTTRPKVQSWQPSKPSS